MNRDNLLLELYKGRQIVEPEFSKYFQPNGTSKNWFIYYVEDNGEPQFELHAYIEGNIVDHVKTFKADVFGGHGRPTVEEHGLTAVEKKYAYEVFDLCFRDQAADELDAIIDHAISVKAAFDGYVILKHVSGGVMYVTPDGKKAKLQEKRILQALDYSHIDISILRDATVAEEFMGAFGKSPYQPLFAILKTVDATAYPNYQYLNGEYWFNALKTAVDREKLSACKKCTNVLGLFPDRIPQLCSIAISNQDNTTLQWLMQNTETIFCNLASCIAKAVWCDNEEAFSLLLDSGRFEPELESSPSWNTAIYQAAKNDGKAKYMLPLLQHGYYLPEAESGYYLRTCSLDQIKNLLAFNVQVDQATVDRVVAEERWDIIDILEQKPGTIKSKLSLLYAFIKQQKFERFVNGLENGYLVKGRSSPHLEYRKLFLLAFDNGQDWVDALLQNGFDINVDESFLLHIACEEGRGALISYLLDHGANPYLREDHSPTVMEQAAGSMAWKGDRSAQAEICKILLEHGVDPILECTRSPSCLCYMNSFPKDFRLFLCDWLSSHGKINTADHIGKTDHKHLPLYHALNYYKYDEDVCNRYLDHGAVGNAAGITNDYLFVSACEGASIHVLSRILQAGGNINETDFSGRTGLMYALWRNRDLEVIRFLIENGAAVNHLNTSHPFIVRNSDHQEIRLLTPLDIAKARCSDKTVDYLISVGARPGAEYE